MVSDKRKRPTSVDACPFPPDGRPEESNWADHMMNVYDGFFGNWRLILSTLVIATITLAYSLTSTAPALVTPFIQPESWNFAPPEYNYTPTVEDEWVPLYKNQTVHEGDLLLEGDDVFLIENCTYVLHGILMVTGNARIILRNAELFIQEKSSWVITDLTPFPVHLCFNESAVFECYNSTISYTTWGCTVVFFMNSKAIILSSDLSEARLTGEGDSSIMISNSNVHRFDASERSTIEVVDSEIDFIGHNSAYRFHGNETEPIYLDWDRSKVEIWNSSVNYISLAIEDFTAVEISAPHAGFYEHWTAYEDLGIDGRVFNITLHDSKITEKWGLEARNGYLSFRDEVDLPQIFLRDCILSALNCTVRSLIGLRGSSLELENCYVYQLYLSENSDAYISRSKVSMLATVDYLGIINFNDVLLDEWLRSGESLTCQIKGTVTIRGKSRDAWERGSVSRVYHVQTQSELRVTPDVQLSLYDEEDDLVWRGQTDKNGEASFNASFKKFWWDPNSYEFITNYRNGWTLVASWKDDSKTVTVEPFLTDSPITFTFELDSEPIMWALSPVLTPISSAVIIVAIAIFTSQRLRKNLKN